MNLLWLFMGCVIHFGVGSCQKYGDVGSWWELVDLFQISLLLCVQLFTGHIWRFITQAVVAQIHIILVMFPRATFPHHFLNKHKHTYYVPIGNFQAILLHRHYTTNSHLIPSSPNTSITSQYFPGYPINIDWIIHPYRSSLIPDY